MDRIKKYIRGLVFVLALLASTEVFAAVCGVSRGAGGAVQPECPNGKITRTDISPKCLEDINNAPGSCVNTMPTTNINRIPEDVCYRGAGWDNKRNHNGIDYAAPIGAPVTAAADGVVTLINNTYPEPPYQTCQSGYGNVIYLEHEGCEGKWTTRYGHLNRKVDGLKVGDKVTKGQLIGYVGGTGGACGRPHLHFEMRGPGEALINPLCDQVQSICSCQSPTPAKSYNDCRDTPLQASSSSGEIAPPATGYMLDPANSIGSGTVNDKCNFEEYREKLQDKKCKFCRPFLYIFNTASIMAKVSFDGLAEAVSIVMVVAFALWLCAVTLKFVSSFEIKEPRIYVKTVLNQAMKVLIIYVILNSDLAELLALTLDPVFMAGLELAQLGGRINEIVGQTAVEVSACDLTDPLLKVVTPEEGGGLSTEMGKGILCTIDSIQQQIMDLKAFGRVAWCMSWKEAFMGIFPPHLGYMITGILLIVGAFLLMFIYPYLLINVMLKMAISIAILPAALGAFAFKITSKYLTLVWESFMNAIFNFIFLSMIIFIITHIAADAMSDILGGDSRKILSFQFGWWMVEILKIFFICLLGWGVLSQAKEFGDKFASGLKLDNNPEKIGSAVGAAAKWGGKKVAKAGWKGAKAGGRVAGNAGSSLFHRGKLETEKRLGERGGKEVIGEDGRVKTDEQGNTVYNTTNLFQRAQGKRSETSFGRDADGHIVKNNTVYFKGDKGSKSSVSNRYATNTTRTDGQGNTKVSSTFHSAALQRLQNADGSINKKALDQLMQGDSTFSRQEKVDMVARALFAKRINKNTYTGKQFEDPKAKTKNREVSKDDAGNEVVTYSQTYDDGSKTQFSVTMGNNNRIMTSVSNTNANGESVTLSTDGMIKREDTATLVGNNADGSPKYETSTQMAFTDYYNKQSATPLDSKGRFDNRIPIEQTMFKKDALDRFTKQVQVDGNKAYDVEDLK